MTQEKSFISELQQLMANHAGMDFNQAFQAITDQAKNHDPEYTPDGRIKVPMPFKNGTTTHQWCELLAKALIQAEAPIFNLAGTIVHITNTSHVAPLTTNSFIPTIEKYIAPCAMKSKDDPTMVYQPLKEPLAKITLHSDTFLESLPEIYKIHHQITPALLENGSFHINKKGYDPESKIFTLHSAIDYDQDLPIDQAIKIWRNWHKEFPFADWSSQLKKDRLNDATSRSFSVHTCACLSLFAGAMFPKGSNRIGYIYASNSQRSGKSLLADMATGISYNNNSKHPWYYDDEKMKGVLDTILNTRAPYLYFDNIRGKIQSPNLESFFTYATCDIRPFHTQQLVTKENVATVFITGNSLEWNADIKNRTLSCDLNITTADPQSRTIERIIDIEAIQSPSNRAELLSCLMSFVKNWIILKRPMPSKTKAGFHRTTSIIIGIVHQLGLGNPLEDRPDEAFGGGDKDFQDMSDLIEVLAEKLNEFQREGTILWDEIITILIERNSFESKLDYKTESRYEETENGPEKIYKYKLTQASNRRLSHILNADFGGRVFTTKSGKKIKWDSRGKKRSKKYTFELVK